jgi:hypothetical protein
MMWRDDLKLQGCPASEPATGTACVILQGTAMIAFPLGAGSSAFRKQELVA